MKKWIFCYVLLACFFVGNGQNLRITNINEFTNAAILGSSYNGGLTIVNEGSTAFSGLLRIKVAVDTSVRTIGEDSSLTQIPLGDSIVFPVFEEFLPGNGYKVGGNVIVVWPSVYDPINNIEMVVGDTLSHEITLTEKPTNGPKGLRLRITNISAEFPDSIVFESVYNTNLTLVNEGDTFEGSIFINATVQDSNGVVSSPHTLGGGSANVVVNTGDTVSVAINEAFSENYNYKVGRNLINAWPSVVELGVDEPVVAGDTVEHTVQVLPDTTTGLHENEELYKKIMLYPNPSKHRLNILSSEEIRVKGVRIMNVSGVIVFEKGFQPVIDISLLSNGLYFLELFLEDDSVVNYKVIKK